MESGSEIIIPIGSQKHDPAWKHCLLIRSGDRTQLKCMYCMKLFLGGGIHRIKEHLAQQKGNASSCPKVPSEVQCAMQQNLESVAVRKKKKLKLAEEIKWLNPWTKQIDTLSSQNEVDTGLQMVSLPDMLDVDLMHVEVKEEVVARTSDRGRRRVRSSPPLFPPTTPDTCLTNKSNSGLTREKDQAYMAIGRFLYEAGVPLDSVNSVYFQPMIDDVASAGPGLELPSYHDFRGWILKRSVEEVNGKLEHYKGTWGRTGCSILADEWTTRMGKTLIDFLVYCPEGTMFLKSVDASNMVTSADTLYELLKHVVEEVGVKDVVQVITNNTECHVVAGKMLTETFPTMFWTPCAARCLDSMLEDIGKLDSISEIIEHAKSITRFIYSHGMVLNMMRKYTDGKDLLLPGDTRSSMNFITLKNMASLEDNLRAMVNSQEWVDCPYSKKPAGIAIADLICCSSFWSSCSMVVRLTEPLVRVYKIVDSNMRPAVGYFYVGMHQVKDVIKKELKNKNNYMPYWNIINWRWNRQQPHPLHAAGFFLNPQFFYSIQGEVSNTITSGMLDCIERLVPDIKIQDRINKELSLYTNAAGDFGRKIAVRARHNLLPAEWWSTYGGGCPNLTRLAIRILSQTCSARGCERKNIPLEQIHNQRMNNLEHQRLCDLVFVQYNLRLQQRQLLNNKPSDPISVDNIDIADDWVVEKSELLCEEDEYSSWMVLNQPLANGMLSESGCDGDAETFITGLDNEVIHSAAQVAEDDDYCRTEEDSLDDTSINCI